MLYAIHNEAGEITQANQLFADPKGYDDRLRELGYSFVKGEPGARMPHPERWHVHDGKLRERRDMFVVVDKTIIKAGGVDAAVLRGCPIGATFAVVTGGHVIDSGTIDEPDMEVPSLVPCKITVIIDRWPFKTLKIDIEATA